MHTLIRVVLLKHILMKYFGYEKVSEFNLINRKAKVLDIENVSLDEEIDFIRHRSMNYIYRLALWTPLELAKMFSGLQTIPLISDQQLAYVLLNSVFAHSVTWNEKLKMFHFVLEGVSNLCLFQGFYMDAREVFLNANGSKIIIKMYNGKEYSSDGSSTERADFDQAKLHLQVCLTYYAPGLAHNHVHFVFPTSFCVLSKQHLNHKGVLYKLLSPHFRFTEGINQQALRVGKATNNKRSPIDRLFFFWQPFPVTKEEFIEGVALKCDKYYYGLGSRLPEEEDEDEISDSTSDDEDIIEMKKELRVKSHSIFPPKYITDKSLNQIPYFKFLKSYYLIVRKFVKRIECKIDREEWKTISNKMTEFVPRFNEVNMIDAITSFIHQVAITHFCDHKSYLKYFAWKYGCMTLRYPFKPYSGVRHWRATFRNNKRRNFEAVKKNPELLVLSQDVMRTRCFLNVFVDFIENQSLPMELVKTEYNFGDKFCDQIADEFITDLKKNDERLKKRQPEHQIEQLREEIRAEGLQLVLLNKIIRSVCY